MNTPFDGPLQNIPKAPLVEIVDVSSNRNFLQMDVRSFEELLQLEAPVITRGAR